MATDFDVLAQLLMEKHAGITPISSIRNLLSRVMKGTTRNVRQLTATPRIMKPMAPVVRKRLSAFNTSLPGKLYKSDVADFASLIKDLPGSPARAGLRLGLRGE